MKSQFGMDAPDTGTSELRYISFKDLSGDVEALIDMLWASATREFFSDQLFERSALSGFTCGSVVLFFF